MINKLAVITVYFIFEGFLRLTNSFCTYFDGCSINDCQQLDIMASSHGLRQAESILALDLSMSP